MSRLFNILKNNAKLKRIVHRLLIPKNQARPRLWVRWILNPFFHKKGKGSIIRYNTRMDVLPFNLFELGDNSVIEDFSVINNGVGHVKIGNDTLIGMGNVIIGPVTLGNNIIIAQNVVISGLNHEYKDIHLPISKQPINVAEIIIEDDCWIAANVVITAGVHIGKHAVVAAGSVVTKNVPAFTITAGNPSKSIKQYNAETATWDKI
jgi:acetyltransferase-like isoleucine patch superfamily enzyme